MISNIKNVSTLFFLGIILSTPFIFYTTAQASTICMAPTLSDKIMIGLPIAALIAAYGDPIGQGQHIASALTEGISVATIKHMVLEMRPLKSNRLSFPSGHTAIAFESAAFIHRRYSFSLSLPFYILSTAVAWSRVCNKAHYWNDVIVGVIFGAGSVWINTIPLKPARINKSTPNTSQPNSLTTLHFSTTF